MKRLNITVLEPFFSGSHQKWAQGLQKHSHHNIEILSLPGRHWKWRMHGGAVSLAKAFNDTDFVSDLILGTSMLDLTTFLSLCRDKTAGIPTAMYFHENQLTYPWSPVDEDVDKQRDNHYCFINYVSALAADQVFFNSEYHRQSFLDALPEFLQQFPDKREKDNVDAIASKSMVLHLGMELSSMDAFQSSEKEKYADPVILWNHRWEYDKNPREFFEVLFKLQEEEHDFKLVVLGERTNKYPPVFDEAKAKLSEHILHWGYADSFEEYARWLWRADVYPVTSNQDFFGGSVVEAMYCNCYPLLPNRLAYPEHIPQKIHRDYLYENRELQARLESAIRDFMVLRQVDYQSMVKHYDWSAITDNYDRRLLQVVDTVIE
ncbi:MAG: DUF3524 domain-containing protein [Balneolaceae bacterium]|nr:DUF3524 domain-containing protein [Balneolaceae bacterium]